MAKKTRKAATTGTTARLRQTWAATLEALTAAEREIGRQVKGLLKKNNIDPKQARATLRTLGARVQSQRKRALAEMDARLSALQLRLEKERKVIGRSVDEAVQGALAAFNIPSRREVAELTRKVEALTRKIDGLKRRPAPRRATAGAR